MITQNRRLLFTRPLAQYGFRAQGLPPLDLHIVANSIKRQRDPLAFGAWLRGAISTTMFDTINGTQVLKLSLLTHISD